VSAEKSVVELNGSRSRSSLGHCEDVCEIRGGYVRIRSKKSRLGCESFSIDDGGGGKDSEGVDGVAFICEKWADLELGLVLSLSRSAWIRNIAFSRSVVG
jgi:hypothetical protein